ncbi:hypothetical protein JX265_007288 [Neoarthrinium moseri]|uniref:Uncharacterized protein n=1 Tax=Neoarthrinium moseri TaxID=1658444 RepID=A0A9Q0AN92_9PEZI|nr:hypothetical protein JX265_007288 [Neoarthrinium moseri]
MRTYEGIWTKKLLVPCWVLQCICSAIFIIAAILALVAASRTNKYITDSYGSSGYSEDVVLDAAKIEGAVILVVATANIVINIVEACLYVKRKLNPVIALVFACLKTLVWLGYFILIIIAATSGTVSILSLILGLILAATSVIQLIASSKYTHQKRKGRFALAKQTSGSVDYV